MVEIAKRNALEAGLAHDIEFKQMQVADFTTDKDFGIMISNPPHTEIVWAKMKQSISFTAKWAMSLDR